MSDRQELRHRLTASSPRSRTTVFNGTVILRHSPRGSEVCGAAFAVRACIKVWVCLVYVERLAGFGVVAVGRTGLSTDDTPPLYLP